MAKRKITPAPADNIAKQIMETYHLQDAQEIQDAVKRNFALIFEAALKGEMQSHLGYASHERTDSDGNSRNGCSEKRRKTTLGEVPIRVPRDRRGFFEPQIVKKHQRDVSSIEGKVLALYGRGMSQRDIAATVEDVYGFKMSHEQISHITGCIMEQAEEWRNRPLKPFCPFVFVDCLYVSLHTERGIRQTEVHVVPAYDMDGTRVCSGFGSTKLRASMHGYSSFCKVTKKGSFPNEDAVFRLLYLRVQQLCRKRAGRKIPNWALVRNQLLMDERMASLMERYDTTY